MPASPVRPPPRPAPCWPSCAAASACAVADDAAADHPLVSSLKPLCRLVFSPAAVLRPFLDAVRSKDAGAAVTLASLAALHEVMALMGPSLTGTALREVVDAVSSCRFEARAEAAAEEAVLTDAAGTWLIVVQVASWWICNCSKNF
uniref:Uncharacterized protein n=1 Tax=Oryza glumipatula TaxID=40148 RepID=A0A0E0BIM4_9ORYZ